MKFERYVSQEDLLVEFGQRIRTHRLARNLSQEEVSLQAGVSISALSALESGRRSIDLLQFLRICLALRLEDRIPDWIPALPEPVQGHTRARRTVRRRASKRRDPIPDPDDDPVAYWLHVDWVWEP